MTLRGGFGLAISPAPPRLPVICLPLSDLPHPQPAHAEQEFYGLSSTLARLEACALGNHALHDLLDAEANLSRDQFAWVKRLHQ